MTKGQQAIRDLARAMHDRTGNLPLFPGIYPDYSAPIVRNSAEGRELVMARWGMPVILTNPEEIDLWMTGTPAEALSLKRPLADNSLRVVARGGKEDAGGSGSGRTD